MKKSYEVEPCLDDGILRAFSFKICGDGKQCRILWDGDDDVFVFRLTSRSAYSTGYRNSAMPDWCSGSCYLDVSPILPKWITAIKYGTKYLLNLHVSLLPRSS